MPAELRSRRRGVKSADASDDEDAPRRAEAKSDAPEAPAGSDAKDGRLSTAA